MLCGGFFDVDGKSQRLKQIIESLEDPEIWQNLERSQQLNQKRVNLERTLHPINTLQASVSDALELWELAEDEGDSETLESIAQDVVEFGRQTDALEFRSLFSGELDSANAFVDIKPGSGGTEAQDWAQMLFEMYDHWARKKGFEPEVVDYTQGDVAGIKNATLKLKGDYAYGWIRTESGIHRLVRKSPFDSGQRRHTSFASVFCYPEVNQQIDIEIDPGDIRIDTYRSSGAGGQHVNKTDSAVRITHNPTGVVVQCQNDRSQHKNKATAMNMLKARLYDLERQKSADKMKEIEDSKPDISWGHQIRSYVLDQSRIKDIRTGVETGNIDAVLHGELDQFIEASLKAGL